MQRILVAIKPWERELPIAAQHICKLAQGAGARIEVVGSVFDAAVSARRERGDVLAQRAQSRTVAAARASLERLASSIRECGARVGTRVVWGVPPYEAILDAAEEWEADLLVVGTHEPGALHTRLTDTDWQLIRRSHCPLLLVKGAAFTGYRTILAAVDAPDGRGDLDRLDRDVLAAGRAVARACNSTMDTVASTPRAIIDAAAHRRAELVIVGAARHCKIAAAFTGNTAEAVAGQLPCDVLVVPMADARRTAAQSKVG